MSFVSDPTKPKSMKKEAMKKRRQRANRKARQQAANESGDIVLTEGAKPAVPDPERENAPVKLPVHITAPVTASDSPDSFTHVPEPLSAESPIGEAPVVGTSSEADPSATPQEPSNGNARTDIPKPETTLGEAQLFGKLVVGYFQIGTMALFAKDPRTQQAFVGLASSLPEFQGPGGPAKMSPDQAYAALCGFVGGCAERVALKYNLRLPYMDEIVVAGAIGIASYGLVPKKKPKNDNAAAQAKNANPAPNGASTNPDAKAEADSAGAMQPGAVPIHADNAPDLDEMH